MLLFFSCNVIVFAVFLWLGMKITRVNGAFVSMVIIASITSILRIIPFAGIILAPIGMCIMICKWTDAEFWPDAVLMVLVSNLIPLVLLAGL